MIPYHKKILENGMKIIIAPMKQTQIVTMGFFVEAGSRNETDENNGIAHFLEHMMFKGTTNRTPTQIFDELDLMGAEYNAATTMQYTYYYLYGNMDDTKKLLDITLDIYINPSLSLKEINRERKVIIEEKRMRNDSPFSKLFTVIHKRMFEGTSLAREIIGTNENIENMTRKQFVDFRKTYYRPENTVFVVVGNVNPVMIMKIIESSLKKLSNQVPLDSKQIVNYSCEKEIILKKMSAQDQPYVYIKKNTSIQQAYVLLGFPMEDLYNKYCIEINFISDLLAGGSSSRLNKALREREGITYTSNAYPMVYSDCGIFFISMTVHPDHLIKALKIIMRELKKIKSKEMTEYEHKKLIAMYKNNILYSLLKPIDYLVYFGMEFLDDGNKKIDLKKELSDANKVKREDVKGIAKEIFIRDKINLFMYGNISQTKFDFLDL